MSSAAKPPTPITDPQPPQIDHQRAQAYWRANIRLVGFCLTIWFLASYGCGILLADYLNQFQLFGFKLGFWFAQQGSIYIFLLVILYYVLRINALDRRFDVHEEITPAGDH
jgi:putative solute:sodium symporter small subunit